jgi:hypothetical protein
MMGYHNNEETTKKCINDACRFINDRERYKYLAQLLMDHMKLSDADIVGLLLKARAADFDGIRNFLASAGKNG